MFCRIIAAAELLDKLHEFLKRAKDHCIIACVGTKIQLRNGASSRFFDAHSAISAVRFADNCAGVPPVNEFLFGAFFLSQR